MSLTSSDPERVRRYDPMPANGKTLKPSPTVNIAFAPNAFRSPPSLVKLEGPPKLSSTSPSDDIEKNGSTENRSASLMGTRTPKSVPCFDKSLSTGTLIPP